MATMAIGPEKTLGFVFVTRTVKLSYGDDWQVQTMLFAELATHHRSEPPGATIDKSAVAAPNKAATVATSARRGYIFLSE